MHRGPDVLNEIPIFVDIGGGTRHEGCSSGDSDRNGYCHCDAHSDGYSNCDGDGDCYAYMDGDGELKVLFLIAALLVPTPTPTATPACYTAAQRASCPYCCK